MLRAIAGQVTCEGEDSYRQPSWSIDLDCGRTDRRDEDPDSCLHYITGKRATAKVVYVDPEKPLRCGIEFATSQNIWGMSLPPKDWHEGDLE
jgi:hypothetical protein